MKGVTPYLLEPVEGTGSHFWGLSRQPYYGNGRDNDDENGWENRKDCLFKDECEVEAATTSRTGPGPKRVV